MLLGVQVPILTLTPIRRPGACYRDYGPLVTLRTVTGTGPTALPDGVDDLQTTHGPPSGFRSGRVALAVHNPQEPVIWNPKLGHENLL